MLLFKNGQPFAVITNDRDAEVMGAEVYVTKEGESLRFDALGGDYRVKVITKKVAFDECLLDVTAEGFEVPKQYPSPRGSAGRVRRRSAGTRAGHGWQRWRCRMPATSETSCSRT